MPDKEKLEMYNETDELDVPFLPWLEEAQQQYYEETKGLTPEERGAYWVNVRGELDRKRKLQRKRKQSQASSQPLATLQPVGAIAI